MTPWYWLPICFVLGFISSWRLGLFILQFGMKNTDGTEKLFDRLGYSALLTLRQQLEKEIEKRKNG